MVVGVVILLYLRRDSMYTPVGIAQDAIKMDNEKKRLMGRKQELERIKTERQLTKEENKELGEVCSLLNSISDFEFLP